MRITSAVASLCFLAGMGASEAATFRVHKTADDGTGNTLRWAIELNNANPGDNVIEVQPVGRRSEPMVIKLDSLLPPIKGPVTIRGVNRRGTVGDPPDVTDVIIDGSNFIDPSTVMSCPGETSGFGPNVRTLQKPALAVVDSGGVEISGLEIRNFCIGVLLLRSHDNHVHHNKIHDMRGGAGVMITGDDGAGGATSGLSINNLIEHNVIYDTGDGAECTRGTSHTTYRYNVFYETPNDVSPRSQGIECAGTGNTDIAILNNTFTGYSDGLQLNQASNVTVMGNTITASTYGITASGTNVLIKANVITGNRMGVGPALNPATRVTITQNAIYGNGQPILSLPTSAGGTTNPNSPAVLGIDIGTNGVTPNDVGAQCADGFPDCDAAQNFPVLSATSSWGAATIMLQGTLSSRPNASYTIEFYANHGLNPQGFGEGEVYLGNTTITTGPTGEASFSVVVATADPLRDGSTAGYFTATATSFSGSTSEFSQALPLSRSSH